MQFSTTPTLEGQPIIEYCGVVTGKRFWAPTYSAIFSPASAISSAVVPAPMKRSCVRPVKLRLKS